MKNKKKRSHTKSRTLPEIFVLLKRAQSYYEKDTYARASIVKRSEYQFLQWRDGKDVRRLYLGKKQK